MWLLFMLGKKFTSKPAKWKHSNACVVRMVLQHAFIPALAERC